MFKKMPILLVTILFLSCFTANAATTLSYPDVDKYDWYYDNLVKLTPLKIIQGNDKGYFMPNETVMFNQFVKMVVVALTNKVYTPINGSWDKPYIDKAYELGLIEDKELNYSIPITRNEMAKIIVKACTEEYGDFKKYQVSIKDLSEIPKEYQEYVLKAYSKGLITGYTDGTFGGEKTMRRSEATAVIARLIYKEQRTLPGNPGKPYDRPVVGGGYNDLIEVPIIGNEQVAIYGPKGESNPHDVDFSMLLWVSTQEPLEHQYTDVENLLTKRFGKNNKQVTEIMNYIKKKTNKDYDLPYREWGVNNQSIKVWSPGGDHTIELTVWRVLHK